MSGSDEDIDAVVILNKKFNKQITILYSIPALSSSRRNIILKINQNKPMTLGHKIKPLYITFEKHV